MPLHKIEHVWHNTFRKKKIFKDFPYKFLSKLDLPLWPQPTPGEHGLNKLKSAMLEDASTQI